MKILDNPNTKTYYEEWQLCPWSSKARRWRARRKRFLLRAFCRHLGTRKGRILWSILWPMGACEDFYHEVIKKDIIFA